MTSDAPPAIEYWAEKLKPIIRGLMCSEHMGDVHDELNDLCMLIGVRLEGDYLDMWTDGDWERVS